MNSVVALLDPRAQSRLREALEVPELEQFSNLPDEPLAHLALVGQQPPRLRSATLAIIPIGPRSELHARRLLDLESTIKRRWVLTPAGEKLAEALAATVPAPSADEERRAAARLAQALGDVDGPGDRVGYNDDDG